MESNDSTKKISDEDKSMDTEENRVWEECFSEEGEGMETRKEIEDSPPTKIIKNAYASPIDKKTSKDESNEKVTLLKKKVWRAWILPSKILLGT